ncbi:MAG: hypothetical protein ACTHNS_02620 [Marmoricola sp.]
MRGPRWGLVVGGVGIAALLSGCGAADAGAVSRTAASFYTAVGHHDGAAACHLLAAPTRAGLEQSAKQPCPKAVLGEQLPDVAHARHVEVHGQMAMVRWRGETTFLARYPAGWRVYAAGCTPPAQGSAHADHFDCTVQGG